MADFRTSKNFNSSGTATDGYDIWLDRQDGVDVILAKDVNDLADSLCEAQKSLVDGYAVTTLLPGAVSFEDGQTLVFDASSGNMVAGASGDASFKIQSVATNGTTTIKGGSIILDDGRELVTYDGTGTDTSDILVDLTTVDLDSLSLIEGGSASSGNTYYMYIDLNALGAAITITAGASTGREVFGVEAGDFLLSASTPDSVSLTRFVPLGFVRNTGGVNAWSDTIFGSLAFRRHDLGTVTTSPVVFTLTGITDTSHPAGTDISHNANVPTIDQHWTAQVQTSGGTTYQPNDDEWIVDIVDANTVEVDFSFLASGDTASIKLENTNLSGSSVAPVSGYDSGLVSASTLNALLPISHGLPELPTAMVLLQEVSAGELEVLDVGSFISATSTQLLGDLTSLGATNVRLIANSGTTAIASSFWRSRLVSAAASAFAGDEVFADTSGGAFTVTLPPSPTLGDRVRIADYKDNSATNNITVGRNGENIEGAAADFIIDVDGRAVEMVYTDSTEGWRVLTL